MSIRERFPTSRSLFVAVLNTFLYNMILIIVLSLSINQILPATLSNVNNCIRCPEVVETSTLSFNVHLSVSVK